MFWMRMLPRYHYQHLSLTTPTLKLSQAKPPPPTPPVHENVRL